jgi:hypothetical protein
VQLEVSQAGMRLNKPAVLQIAKPQKLRYVVFLHLKVLVIRITDED